jgi:hypothetical protein
MLITHFDVMILILGLIHDIGNFISILNSSFILYLFNFLLIHITHGLNKRKKKSITTLLEIYLFEIEF